MAKKEDLRTTTSSELIEHIKLPVEESTARIFETASRICEDIRSWYWSSISTKRRASFLFRILSYLLAILGAIAPLAAGFHDSCESGLSFTQFGVIFLALAALLQAADRIFGWSSGWLRYVSTVSQMEELARSFEFEWARYQLEKGKLDETDKLALFQLAESFVQQTVELQNEETRKWVVEFNSGLAVLSDLIKSQRQSTDKVEQRSKTQHSQLQTGIIELTLAHPKTPFTLDISLDNGTAESFTGTQWSVGGLAPGEHRLDIHSTKPLINIRKIVVVKSGEISNVNVQIPTNDA